MLGNAASSSYRYRFLFAIRLCWICFLQQFWLICTLLHWSRFVFWMYSRWFGTIGILARFDIPHFGIEFVYAELLLGLIYPATWPCFALVSTPEQIDPEVYFLWTFAIIKLHNSKLAGVVSRWCKIDKSFALRVCFGLGTLLCLCSYVVGYQSWVLNVSRKV